MKKSTELRRQHTEMLNQMQALMADNKVNEAHALIADLKQLENAVKVQEELEKDEIKTNKVEVTAQMGNVNQITKDTVIAKLMLNKDLTQDEMAFANTMQIEKDNEKGGYLVPVEQFNEIREYRRGLVALKDFCNVIQVASNHGTFPIADDNRGLLENFTEGDVIAEANVTFKQGEYTVSEYGCIIPVSKILLADEKSQLMGFLYRHFEKRAVRTENAKVIELLNKATEVKAKTADDFKLAINQLPTDLWGNTVIITNQTGFGWLDKQVDGNGRPWLQPNPALPTQMMLGGRAVIVLDDVELANTAKTKAPFYIGSVSDYIDFFDRGVREIAQSEHALFNKAMIAIRMMERFDIKVFDKDAMRLIKIDTATVDVA